MAKYSIPPLNTEDFVFSANGIVNVTIRQFLLLVFAALIVINEWMSLGWLEGVFSLLFWILVIVPFFLAFLFGWVTVNGRHLEWWMVVLVRFWKDPHVYVWRSQEYEEDR